MVTSSYESSPYLSPCDEKVLRTTGAHNYHVPQRLEGRAGDIVQTARALFEEHGVSHVSICTIAQTVGVTRELVYYYFSGKQALVDAVIDDYVIDFSESISTWNENRVFNDVSGETTNFVAAFHRCIFDAHGLRPSFRVIEELHLREEFLSRVTVGIVDYIIDNVVDEYAHYHQIEISDVYEMFCLLVFGLVGLMMHDPNIPQQKLVHLVEQTLHLDIEHHPTETLAQNRTDSGSLTRIVATQLRS